MNYQTHADSCEQKATIRTRPRRIIEDDELYYYPKERQPLCFDPLVEKLGKNVQDTILLQSLYKYIKDIIILKLKLLTKQLQILLRAASLSLFRFQLNMMRCL